MLRPSVLALVVCALALAACERGATEVPTQPGSVEGEAAEPGPDEASAEASVRPAIVGRELPGELVAELRLRGDDEHGRLLTLAPGFVATAECSDCGAPSYLRFLAVRCLDEHHCEVLTEHCEGSIARDADTYELEFHVVEGIDLGDEEAPCVGYSGTFERP